MWSTVIEERVILGASPLANRKFTTDKLFQFEVMPALLSCNFIVDSTNGNGFGARSLKGEGIARVYMHTTATPDPGNPNPAAGIILVQFTDVYARSLGAFNAIISGVGSPSASTTASVPNTIVSLGTATLAQFQAVGLPLNVVPAVGVSFIATSSASIGGSAMVSLAVASGIDHIEGVGDPSSDISSLGLLPVSLRQPIGQTNGGYQLMRCMLNSTVTAPADGTVISLNFLLSNSGNTTRGQ
jgi:hypothetical protein